MSYDRYAQLRAGNEIQMVPFVELPEKSSDRFEIYRKGQTRLDQVSSHYYDSPDYAWLIMQANGKYGSAEFSIPDGAVLRIPYPLEESLQDYQKGIEKYKKYYN